MKMPSRFLLFLSASILCIASSQITADSASKGLVAPEKRLSIAQSRYSGQWKGPDLTVTYRYSRDQGQMDLTGSVSFADSLRLGYSLLRDFRLSLIFLDENGRVLGSNVLVTNRGSFDAIPFHVTLRQPSSAVSMTFRYQGEAIESGRSGTGGVTSFWYGPID